MTDDKNIKTFYMFGIKSQNNSGLVVLFEILRLITGYR